MCLWHTCSLSSFFLSQSAVKVASSFIVRGGREKIRTCSCLAVYKIIGAGRNVFAAIIICSLASTERGIKFFTVSCVSELLGLLEDAEHLGHIV